MVLSFTKLALTAGDQCLCASGNFIESALQYTFAAFGEFSGGEHCYGIRTP